MHQSGSKVFSPCPEILQAQYFICPPCAETVIQIAAEIAGCIDTAAGRCQTLTAETAEAFAVLFFRVHLPLEFSCGTASMGTPNLLLHKVSWPSLTYCLMYFEIILADLLLKQIRNTCVSLSAGSALMRVPSSRKAIMSETSTDAFTKVIQHNFTAQ